MKFLHLADLHIGKLVNGFSMLEDQRHILRRVLSLAKEHEADAIVIAGDLYDRSQPPAEAVKLVSDFLDELAGRGIACFCVAGNHDSPERVAYVSSLMEREGIYVSPVFDGTLAHFELEDDQGPVTFWLMPYLRPVDVREHFPEAEVGQSYTEAVRTVLDSCQVDTNARNVLVAHQFVTAQGQETLRSDSELSVGGVDQVDADVFGAFDYLVLGHIHRPQRVGPDTLRYAGSPLKYSASEIRYPKSAPLVDLGPKGQVSIDLLPLEPLHDMRHIEGPLDDLVSEEVVADQAADDYLFVTLTDELPPVDALSRLRSVYPNVMGIEFQNSASDATGAAGVSLEELQRIDPMELFGRLFQEQNGRELSEGEREQVQKSLVHALGPEGSDD